ncbi:cytosolic sulfotransferase 15-like [Vigna umbellata]|uniref:cytosolic sulfotransferase 15-like n=1 Tax=Vigna umbellata TaxID=87088 RepID=UPI001F5F09C0|nr:cytosolic sulfotransferase 15-like [Vigna umbellata]
MASSIGWQQENEEEDKLISSLPKEKGWSFPYVYLFEHFWCPSPLIRERNIFQKHFQGKQSDVLVTSFPKSGTTWLKALTFAIVNHKNFSKENHPLLTSNPHQLVPPLYTFRGNIHDQILQLSNMPEPRLFGTHIPYPSLPRSIVESHCRIIYICRNPFDTFISAWAFYNKIKVEASPALTKEEAFEMFCNGVIEFGPWWSHVLGYWNESVARPNTVLFLKYEDLKEDVNSQVKKVAEFLGCPFTEEEESNGVIESIAKLCSFEEMKDTEVNKSGKINFEIKRFENKLFFRKAEIGDWVNHFSPSMVEKLSKIIEEKFSGSGLSFKMHS